jgi:hypothetical protein
VKHTLRKRVGWWKDSTGRAFRARGSFFVKRLYIRSLKRRRLLGLGAGDRTGQCHRANGGSPWLLASLQAFRCHW